MVNVLRAAEIAATSIQPSPSKSPASRTFRYVSPLTARAVKAVPPVRTDTQARAAHIAHGNIEVAVVIEIGGGDALWVERRADILDAFREGAGTVADQHLHRPRRVTRVDQIGFAIVVHVATGNAARVLRRGWDVAAAEAGVAQRYGDRVPCGVRDREVGNAVAVEITV